MNPDMEIGLKMPPTMCIATLSTLPKPIPNHSTGKSNRYCTGPNTKAEPNDEVFVKPHARPRLLPTIELKNRVVGRSTNEGNEFDAEGFCALGPLPISNPVPGEIDPVAQKAFATQLRLSPAE